MIKNYRISVDEQFYTGESDMTIDTFINDPWSSNSFHTQRQNRTVLKFEPKENNNFKTIVGTQNLLGEIKRVIEFINYTDLMVGNEIVIEAEPYKIPPEINLESELSKQKSINAEMKNQLDIATDLGEKRFQEIQKLSHAKEAQG